MQKPFIRPVGICKKCGGPWIMIATKDGWGDADIHEYHCNRCGYCKDAEGQIRNPGSLEGLTFLYPRKEF